jgi:hypothetical protein
VFQTNTYPDRSRIKITRPGLPTVLATSPLTLTAARTGDALPLGNTIFLPLGDVVTALPEFTENPVLRNLAPEPLDQSFVALVVSSYDERHLVASS